MPGPEERKRKQEAKRQAALKVLREEYHAREELKSGGFVPKKILNTQRDNTSTATTFRIPPPVHFTGGHIMEFDNEGKMHIHKDSSNSASLKRKAEDHEQGPKIKKAKPTSGFVPGTGKPYKGTARIELDSPPSGRVKRKAEDHEEGHKAKKAKPTSGYMPGTGKSYKGTARIEPNSPPSGHVRALGDKPTNAPLKIREQISKQDTKNLNRNASKLKVHTSKGMSQTSQGPPKVTEQEAVKGDEANSIQNTRRNGLKAAKPDTMADVKNGHLQGSKRKMDHDLDSKMTKKARISPGIVAIRSPKTIAKAEGVGVMKKAGGESLGKRQREETNAGSERSKNTKLSTSRPDGWKVQSSEEEPPKGLENHKRACFANAGLQGLFGVPEIMKHYEARKEQISEKLQSIRGNTKLMRAGQATRGLSKEGKELNININKAECFIGAYFGELVNTVRKAPGNSSVSPYAFLQACGSIFKDDDGRPLNGDTSQDTSQFLDELLKRLDEEEKIERAKLADTGKSSFIEELFHVQSRVEEAGVRKLCLVLPTSEEPIMLGDLIDRIRTAEVLDDFVCSDCQTIGMTTQEFIVKKLPKYVIVQAPRARHMEKQSGNRRWTIIRKNHTLVELPIEALSLSSLLKGDESNEAHRYEVFGTVQHKGHGTDDGHYVAMRKTNGQWYCINDKKVELISKEKLPSLCEGQIFFLRRVE